MTINNFHPESHLIRNHFAQLHAIRTKMTIDPYSAEDELVALGARMDQLAVSTAPHLVRRFRQLFIFRTFFVKPGQSLMARATGELAKMKRDRGIARCDLILVFMRILDRKLS